jgi:ferredoxin-NADP reductase
MTTTNSQFVTANAVSARISAKTSVADGVLTLTLTDPDGQRLPDWTPGSHVDLMLPNGTTRQYSLCGDRWDAYSYRVGVLREPAGRGGSAYVHDELAEGAVVGIGGPRNNFHLVPAKRYIFIAGGIGITPILPMIAQADLLGADWTLIYGGRTRSSMAFLDELTGYGDRVQIRPQDEFGLLDLPAVLGQPSPDVKVYCCGPGPLIRAVELVCEHWPVGALRVERFVAKAQGAPVRDLPFVVDLARTGTSVTVTSDMSVLDAVRGAGVAVLSSCRQGTCGTCETGVIAGDPDHRDSLLDDAERQTAGCMFICVSRSCSDRLVLDL